MKLVPTRLQSYRHIREHNWLIHDLVIGFLSEIAPQYASGTLVDIGCGKKPYDSLFAPYVERYIGLDLRIASTTSPPPDLLSSAHSLAIRDRCCETVFCSEVLEHLEEPGVAIQEMNRVLKEGGFVILTVPFFWPVHEAPRDFFRYSEYGLRYLFEKRGFEIIEIRPFTGYIVTATQLSIYFWRRFQKGRLLRTAGRIANWGLQHLARKLNAYDSSTTFANGYGLVARKLET